MATTKKRAAEIQAGVVVLIGIGIVVASLYWISGGADQFRATTDYTVFLPNAGGLQSGYEVFLDGRRVGEVSDVRAANDSERPATIHGREYANFSVAVVRIFSSERIPEDSAVEITRSITGTVTMLMFSGKSPNRATASTVFHGRARADFEKATDEAVALVNDARITVQRATEVVGKVEKEIEALRIEGLRADVDAFLVSANDFASRASKWMDDAEEPAMEAVRRANEGLDDFRGLASEVRRDWRDDVKPRISGTLDEAKGLLEENRPTLRSFLQKLDDFGSLANKTIVRIDDLAADLKGTVAESRPHLVETLRQARQGMADFKDAANTLKTSPWMLLNKPSGKEVESIVFYDAAKQYLEAAREVRAAVDDLQTLERLGGLEDEQSKESVERATQRLQEATQKMAEQEDTILKELAKGK